LRKWVIAPQEKAGRERKRGVLMRAIITLTTDFGLADAYVAAMKGVILGINPEATLVDICHTIEPQNILQAAFVLSTACEFFPPKTIHLVVVDPGVGTERGAIILRTSLAYFVAPDNGVLSYVMPANSFEPLRGRGQSVRLRAGLKAIAITRQRFWRSPVSSTFHGRDIFAPVAAHLSLGFTPSDFGEKRDSVIAIPYPHPHQAPNDVLTGCIMHIDRFGNLITNIKSEDLSQEKQSISIELCHHVINTVVRTYAEGEDLMALIGSSDHLEIAVKDGSAAIFLGAKIGDEVKVRNKPK
jgi:S-adenosylmethionine hydrolase